MGELQKIAKAKSKITFDKEVTISESYELKIQGEEGYNILTNQSMDIFCNYCFKIYKSYSFFLPFAMK